MLARRRIATAVVCALAALSAVAPAAAAAADPGTKLLPAWIVLGADVRGTCPGAPAPRHMNSKHATAFIQSFYIATIIGTLPPVDAPPASLPKCTFKATERINGLPFTFTAFYVTNGTGKTWVGLPPQTIGPGAFVSTEKWFVAPPRSTPGIRGELDPVIRDFNTTTTAPPAVKTTSHKSSSSAAGWAIAGAAILAGVVLIVVLGRARRKAAQT